mmetsp:Transcript_51381/g.112085  ORF Transcript_51381/g.112085 Transcript_51381/m.112085 type:complete len:406 (-) Transcript_51381:173-1390(-)
MWCAVEGGDVQKPGTIAADLPPGQSAWAKSSPGREAGRSARGDASGRATGRGSEGSTSKRQEEVDLANRAAEEAAEQVLSLRRQLESEQRRGFEGQRRVRELLEQLAVERERANDFKAFLEQERATMSRLEKVIEIGKGRPGFMSTLKEVMNETDPEDDPRNFTHIHTQPQPLDNAAVPSWIPGWPGIDAGSRYSDCTADVAEILILLVIGWLYQSYVVNRRKQLLPHVKPLENPPITVGAFDCFDDMPICLWSCCCTTIRMGDSLQAVEVDAGVCPGPSGRLLDFVTAFWAPLCVFAASRVVANLIGLVPGMPAGLPTMTVLVFRAIIFAKWRQALFEKLGARGETSSWRRDLMLWIFCSSCAAAQEAREVDRATGVRVGYCFSVEKLEVVGQPVETLLQNNRA